MTNEEIALRLVHENENGKFSIANPIGSEGGFGEFDTFEEASAAVLEYTQREGLTFE
jgi:hypothetical protein